MGPPGRTHAFPDPATSVRRDIAALRHNPFLLPDTRIRGFVLDITTFHLDEIGPAATSDHPAPAFDARRSPTTATA